MILPGFKNNIQIGAQTGMAGGSHDFIVHKNNIEKEWDTNHLKSCAIFRTHRRERLEMGTGWLVGWLPVAPAGRTVPRMKSNKIACICEWILRASKPAGRVCTHTTCNSPTILNNLFSNSFSSVAACASGLHSSAPACACECTMQGNVHHMRFYSTSNAYAPHRHICRREYGCVRWTGLIQPCCRRSRAMCYGWGCCRLEGGGREV